MTSTDPPRIKLRAADVADFDALADLLCEGFGCWDRAYWTKGFAHMQARAIPPGYPRYGFVLEADGVVVGVVLTLFSVFNGLLRCNVSSWYVRKAYQAYGTLMVNRVYRYREATIINASPARFTRPLIEAQGCRRYSEGQVICVPALSTGEPARVRRYVDADAPRMRDDEEAVMMAYHAARGCIALVCEAGETLTPLVFVRRTVRRVWPPYAQLLYCRDTGDFVRFAKPVGRFLLASGMGLVALDGTGPIRGLSGVFLRGHAPRYFKGERAPALNDLAYTEAAVLGV